MDILMAEISRAEARGRRAFLSSRDGVPGPMYMPMNLYVGITDPDWFRFLRGRQADEMNFWRPRNTNDFRA